MCLPFFCLHVDGSTKSRSKGNIGTINRGEEVWRSPDFPESVCGFVSLFMLVRALEVRFSYDCAI